MYYKLSGHDVIPCDHMEWAAFFERGTRRVASSTYRKLWVSTMFIGLEYDIFETMVFYRRRGRIDFSELYCKRTDTWEAAEKAHLEALNLCKTGQITRNMTHSKSRKTTRKSITKFLRKKGYDRKGAPSPAA